VGDRGQRRYKRGAEPPKKRKGKEGFIGRGGLDAKSRPIGGPISGFDENESLCALFLKQNFFLADS